MRGRNLRLSRTALEGAIFSPPQDTTCCMIGPLAVSLSPHFLICLLCMASNAQNLKIGVIITPGKSFGSYVINMGLP